MRRRGGGAPPLLQPLPRRIRTLTLLFLLAAAGAGAAFSGESYLHPDYSYNEHNDASTSSDTPAASRRSGDDVLSASLGSVAHSGAGAGVARAEAMLASLEDAPERARRGGDATPSAFDEELLSQGAQLETVRHASRRHCRALVIAASGRFCVRVRASVCAR
jgi:hypothetical protein